jgi:hypothetical protein
MASTGAEVVKRGRRYGICFAPSQYTGAGVAKLFGGWAEGLVMLNYLKKTKAVPVVTDWFDVLTRVPGLPDPSPVANPIAFFAFLTRHHPNLAAHGDEWNLEFKDKKTAVPDILTAKPDRRDYYEIKPGSATGVRAGNEKLTKLDTLFNKPAFGLSVYKAGTTYTPNKGDDIDLTRAAPRILNIWARRLGLKNIKVVLSFRRSLTTAGLVMYWICVDLEADTDVDEEAVENIARWYTAHAARNLTANTMPTDVQAQPALEFDYALPAVAQLMPSEEAIRVAMLSAGPAGEYAIVGGTAAVELVNEIAKVQMERQRQDFKKMTKVGVPGLPQLYANPTAINRGDYDYQSHAVVMAIGGVNLGNRYVTAVALAAVVVIVVFVTGGTAAAPITVGAGAEGTAAAGAAAGGAALTTEVAVGAAVTETAGGTVTSIAARQAALALTRSVASSPAAAKYALAAGVLLVVGRSGDALASTGQASASPTVHELQSVRLVPVQDIADLKSAGPLGAVTLPGGKKGFVLGRIRLRSVEGAAPGLEPHKPLD